MRAQLIPIACLVTFIAHHCLEAGEAVIERADTAEAIVDWASNHYGSVPHYEFKGDGVRCLVLIPDVGSGVALRTVLIYVGEQSGWSLVMVRKTNTSVVTVNQEENDLVFHTHSGRVLMIVPIASMSQEFDQREQ